MGWAALASGQPKDDLIVRVKMNVTMKYHHEITETYSHEVQDDQLTFTYQGESKYDLITDPYCTSPTNHASQSVSGGGSYLDETPYADPVTSQWSYIPFQPDTTLFFPLQAAKPDPVGGKCRVYGQFLTYVLVAPGEKKGTGPLKNVCDSTISSFILNTAGFMDQFDLPTDKTQYSISWVKQGTVANLPANAGGDGTWEASARVVIEVIRNPAEWEAVIVTDLKAPGLPRYEDWLPIGGENESTPGTNVLMRVELRAKGTTNVTALAGARFFLHLTDTSRQPGVCMNFPSKEKALDTPDLKFQESPDLRVYDDGQSAETVRDDLHEIIVVIDCFDYGAYGKLTADAHVQGADDVHAFDESHPEQKFLRIPKDDKENHIADKWEDQQWALAPDLPATWDEAPSPDGQFRKGDGISLYEKYRGFMFRKVHERLDPMRKHLFVYDPNGCVRQLELASNQGSSFSKASGGIALRFVEDETWTGTGTADGDKRIVNFNSGDFGHAVDQHALHVRLQSARSPMVPAEYSAMFTAKYKTGPAAMDLSQTFGLTFPDGTAKGRMASPRDAFLIEVYSSIIDWYSEQTVGYHTSALAAFAGYETASAADQARMEVAMAAEVRNYRTSHRTEWAQRYWYHLSEVLSHEMGHGVGLDDLNPPNTDGPLNCLMRYFGYDDFPRNTADRLELKARWTSSKQPTVFCHDPTGTPRHLACFEQIQVTDRQAGPSLASIRALTGQQTIRWMANTDSIAFTNAFVHVTATALPALEIGAEFETTSPLAGDPLRVTVHLKSPNWLQALTLAQMRGLTNDPEVLPPAVATNWAEGVRLNLYRVEGTSTRQLVLGQEQWPPFLRELTTDGAMLDELMAARSREWMAAPDMAALREGSYVLTVAWDGRGLVDAASLPVTGLVVGKELEFHVSALTNDIQQATHLRRLAYQEWDTHQDDLARQHGLGAIQLNPGDRSKEGIETYFVVASARLRLQDYLGSAQSVQRLREQFPNLSGTEVGGHAVTYLRALVPELRITPGDGPQAPPRLKILGHPGQTYVLQGSGNLADWTSLSTIVAPSNQFDVTDPTPGDAPRYYRVLWER